jgi:serine/threonine protein kinase
MSSEKAIALFHQALEITDPAQRLGFLQGACADNAELLAHVQKLLAAHEDAANAFPTDPDGDATATVLAPAPPGEGPGSQIGKYKLLQVIGEGGMGVVYMAEQREPFDKRVALKIIKLGMDTKAVVARFEAERQALALMNHPNIAKVLDAGSTETGRPYFVMELVKGEPLTEYCDKHKLSTRQRLELFIPVCQAIQHAHQKGIIHRDIKPSNILVALFDGRPVPMVIDFGIAKATNQRLTQQTVFTNLGQLIGTPAYMSPEQAEGSQLDIDTRSDIYSLGVLLYELLTGSQPFPEKMLRSAGWAGMVKIICEKEPDRPSTRLSTLTEEEQSQLAGAHGGEPPRKIGLVLRRELDLVILKCLQKDRTQRYESANGLAMEIQRYLNGEPVAVVPPTLGYQFAKFARKHKQAVAMAAAIAVILAGATAVSTWQMFRATRAEEATRLQEEETLRQKTATDAINGWLTRHLLPQLDAWSGSRAGQDRNADIKLKDAILQSLENLSEDFKEQPEIEGQIRLKVGKALGSMGLKEQAEENLKRAYELLKDNFGPGHTNTISAQMGWAGVLAAGEFAFDGTSKRTEARSIMKSAYQQAVKSVGLTNEFTLERAVDYVLGLADMGFHREAQEVIAPVADELGLPGRRREKYPLELWMRAGLALGGLRYAQGRIAESVWITDQLYEEARKDRDFSRDIHFADHILQWKAVDSAKNWHRDYDQARRLLEEAITISTNAVRSGWPTPQLFMFRAFLESDLGDPEKRLDFLRQSFTHYREVGNFSDRLSFYSGLYLLYDPGSQADWEGVIREGRFIREEQGVHFAHYIAQEILASRLAGRTNELAALSRIYAETALRELAESNVVNGARNAEPEGVCYALGLPEPVNDLSLLQRMAERSHQHWGHINNWYEPERWKELMDGLLAFHRGENAVALTNLWVAVHRNKDSAIAVQGAYPLAITHHRLRDKDAAMKALEHADALLDGLTSSGWLPFPYHGRWGHAASALLMKEEAGKQILGKQAAPVVDVHHLQSRRDIWRERLKRIETGNLHARRREFKAAATNYAAARELPGQPGYWNFDHREFAVAWAMGDADKHVDTLRRMHEWQPAGETSRLYELVESPWPLPDDLLHRRQQSQARKNLFKRLEESGGEKNASDWLLAGMLHYRETNFMAALTVLQHTFQDSSLVPPTAGRTFAAMAHWELGAHEEARRLLSEADTRYHQTVIEPGAGLYQPYFPPCIMMEMVIKEADSLIDPGVDNAPHVAALPPERW